jgi:hypothetical protein
MDQASAEKLKGYIEQRSVAEPNSGCWLWLLSDGSHGYPQGSMPTVMGERVSLAHRMSYLAYNGEIPDGYEVDHLCRNRCCVNPSHLEATTKHANRARAYGIKVAKDHVSSDGCSVCGSEYHTQASGIMVCKKCHNRRNKKYKERKSIAKNCVL